MLRGAWRGLAVALLPLMLVAVMPPPAWADPQVLRAWVPWRSQFDGTYYAGSNCGPAALGMAMARFGEVWSTDSIRRDANAYMGLRDQANGTSWEALKYAAEKRGLTTYDLYDGEGGYHEWYMDELLAHIGAGRPVIMLVRLIYLPGHEGEDPTIDHYIVFLGLMDNGDVLYHDSAFETAEEGAYQTMSRAQFRRALGNTASGINWSGMAIGW